MSSSFSRLLRRLRHPYDPSCLFTDWEREQINYWLTHHSRRRHTTPFNKTRRGRLRRIERKFILRHQQQETSQ